MRSAGIRLDIRFGIDRERWLGVVALAADRLASSVALRDAISGGRGRGSGVTPAPMTGRGTTGAAGPSAPAAVRKAAAPCRGRRRVRDRIGPASSSSSGSGPYAPEDHKVRRRVRRKCRHRGRRNCRDRARCGWRRDGAGARIEHHAHQDAAIVGCPRHIDRALTQRRRQWIEARRTQRANDFVSRDETRRRGQWRRWRRRARPLAEFAAAPA